MSELFTSGGFFLPSEKKEGTGLLPTPDAQGMTPVPMPVSKRFDIYVIDTGWNERATKMVEENLPMVNKLLFNHAIYVLSPAQALQLCRRFPTLIGNSPMIVVLDQDLVREQKEGGVGFRVNLGYLRDPKAAEGLLRWIVQILTYKVTARDIVGTVHKTMYKEGVKGAVEIVFDTLHSPPAGGGHH